jgi:hypothetical protein
MSLTQSREDAKRKDFLQNDKGHEEHKGLGADFRNLLLRALCVLSGSIGFGFSLRLGAFA